MKKIFLSGIGIHVMIQMIATFLLMALNASISSRAIYIIDLVVIIGLYLFLLNKFSSKIEPKMIIRDIRFILITNTLLISSGFLLFQFGTDKLAVLGQNLIVVSVYFNYGFSPVLGMSLPTVIGFILLAIASPVLLYSGYIMAKK